MSVMSHAKHIPTYRHLYAFICDFSINCNGNCLKCPHLSKTRVVDLSGLVVPTFEDSGCGCA